MKEEKEIVQRAVDSGSKWICITGGEPCEQELGKLMYEIKSTDLHSSIETSGSEFNQALHDFDHVVLSPKDLFTQAKFKCNELVIDSANELKCVVTQESDIDYYLKTFGTFRRPKSFQPMSNDKGIMCLLMKRLKELTYFNWKIRCQQQTVFQIQ